MVKIAMNGRRWNGRGVSTDVVESSIKAYIAAINAMEWEMQAKSGSGGDEKYGKERQQAGS
jgi:2-isopropylmalate synthase